MKRTKKQALLDLYGTGQTDIRTLARTLNPVVSVEDVQRAIALLERSRLSGVLSSIRNDGMFAVVRNGQVLIFSHDDILNAWSLDIVWHGARRHRKWSESHGTRYQQMLLIIDENEAAV